MIKYVSPPTKVDIAPQGTICSLFLNDDGTEQELYIQTSLNENDPVWISAQDLLLTVYKDRLKDASFLADCLKQYIAIIPS